MINSKKEKKSRKIVVAFIIDCITTKEGLLGGTERQLIEIIQRINRERFEPILICLRQNEKVTIWQEIACRKFVLSVESLLSLNTVFAFHRFLKVLRQRSVDIINTYFFDATVFGVITAKLCKISCIISTRRDMGFWYTKKEIFVLKVINRLTNNILVNSQAIKWNVIKWENVNPDKVDIIYNGIDTSRFTAINDFMSLRGDLRIPLNDQIVGIAANLNRHVKRVDLFIEAAAIVLHVFPRTSFLILGDGFLRETLEIQAEKLGIRHKVHFLGFQNDIRPYISLFNIGVITSDSEGFSNAILEYSASGIPVVTTDVGGGRELFSRVDLGEIVSAGDSSKIAEGIIKIMRDKHRRIKIKKMSKILISAEYDWERKIKEHEQYYLNKLEHNKI